jgi:RecA-family ATPase
LHATAKTIRVVSLPDLPNKGDVSDWLDADPRRAEELVDACFDVAEWVPNHADTEHAHTTDEAADNAEPPPRIAWMDLSNWDNEARPEREWAIRDRVPLKQVGLFSGEGGTGKSILEMTKDVAHVAGKDWLGCLPEPRPAFYLGAEDDENEIHIRFYDIAAHYRVTFNELVRAGA